jgi:predicted HTH domain antitoxin
MEAIKAYYDGNAFVPITPVGIHKRVNAIVTILDDDDLEWKGTEQSEDNPRLAVAIELYAQQLLPLAKAARAARMSRGMFEWHLGQHKIPCSFMTYEDVMKDLETIKRVGHPKR